MRFIRIAWYWFFFFAFVLSGIIRIWGVYESRILVAHLYDLRLVEERLLREGSQLALEGSVLVRGSRLQQYADTQLNLHKAAKVRSISKQ